MKILITSGATREPIDQVRFITNMSTGKTGASLAESFAKKGHDVTYLHGQGSHTPNVGVAAVEYSTFSDLNEKLKKILSKHEFDVVLHAAAVSDFSIAAVKINRSNEVLNPVAKLSSEEKLQIELEPNFKILNQIKNYSKNLTLLVIGFKLTFTESESEQKQAVQRLFDGGNVDFVVHNDLKDMKEFKRHIFRIHNPSKCLDRLDSVDMLANKVIKIVEERL